MSVLIVYLSVGFIYGANEVYKILGTQDGINKIEVIVNFLYINDIELSVQDTCILIAIILPLYYSIFWMPDILENTF